VRACRLATARMHAAGERARARPRAGGRAQHTPPTHSETRLAGNPPPPCLFRAGLPHDSGQVGLASGHDSGDIRQSLAEVYG
jgi:hypothetical protein